VERRVVLATGRLELCELLPSDLDFVAEMLADPEVMRFYPKPHTRAESREWLDRQRARYARDGHGLWLARLRAGGEPVGQIGLTVQDVNGVPTEEVGYLVHRPWWRRGFAAEAACAVRDWAFAEKGLARVVSLIRPENLPSQGVARRMGMRRAGHTLHAGMDHHVFAVRREEVRPPQSAGSGSGSV
jgi:RimJ/RimL family protein N-acetyltransferase